MRIVTDSEQQTIKLGERLGRYLQAGDVLGLIGELGSGKTTLVRGIARGLGLKEEHQVASPSFVLIREYPARLPLYHFDLYRLDKIKDIEQLGLQEYLFNEGVCVIEWAEKMKLLLPDYLEVRLAVQGEQQRAISFFAHSKRYVELIKNAFLREP
ncbi:MAG: tRNA (adenosine(37)-N6)-threonylcarbamoyltransferase complex ATPase subunit type 1 TsaE [Candidatus Omnitrophica bacterium]|nr:tRNA (adenosine(37)-N6)-threonylcarbamoyltransferase complex ATPase subunit type 1 TsaE [Candidatus Omnitrophota bacterium]